MVFLEFKPALSLAHLVQCIWVFESSPESTQPDPASVDLSQRIVPDGNPEMLVHYGDQFHEVADTGELRLQGRHLFAGQLSQPLVLQAAAHAGVIGVRFWPGAARALIRLSMAETTDMRLDLADAWGAASRVLQDAVFSAKSIDERVRVVEQFLLRRLATHQSPIDAAVSHCVMLLRQTNGVVSVDTLANQSGLSARQLERRFLQEVGVSPRLLSSIFRFRRLFDVLEEPTATRARWTAAAHSAGYFDQAHMIRDFKRFAGMQPQAFYRSLNGLSAAMVGDAPTALT